MKVSTAKLIIYGILSVGVLIAFIAVFVPALSDSLAMLSLTGGVIVLLGVFFCVVFARTPCCPYCHELIGAKKQSPKSCPHCEKELG